MLGFKSAKARSGIEKRLKEVLIENEKNHPETRIRTRDRLIAAKPLQSDALPTELFPEVTSFKPHFPYQHSCHIIIQTFFGFCIASTKANNFWE